MKLHILRLSRNLHMPFHVLLKKSIFNILKKTIEEEIQDFSHSMHSKNKKFEIKIELKKTELKMEYKSFYEKIYDEKHQLKSIASKITKL